MKINTNNRRNFLPTILVSILLWLTWLMFFLFVPPEALLMPIVFLLLSFLATFFTFALIFGHTRRGLIVGVAAILVMLLNYFHIGNFLNYILLVGILISAEYYFSKS